MTYNQLKTENRPYIGSSYVVKDLQHGNWTKLYTLYNHYLATSLFTTLPQWSTFNG